MGLLATMYCLATLLMFCICAAARVVSPDAERIARAAAWVVFFTGISRLVSYLTDAPWSMVHYPAQDLLLMALSFGWWQVRGELWAWLLGACFLTQLFFHAAFWWVGNSDYLYAYVLANNIVFIVELSLLSVAGGRHVGVWLRDRLRLLRGRVGVGMALGSES